MPMVVTMVGGWPEEVVQQRIQPMDLGLLAEYLVELEVRSMVIQHGNVESLVERLVLQNFGGSEGPTSMEGSVVQQLEQP